MHIFHLVSGFIFFIGSCNAHTDSKTISTAAPKVAIWRGADTAKILKPDSVWKKLLSPEVFEVARRKGTERPWSSKYEKFTEIGTYSCKVCGNPLFKSNAKFDSGCGWPSFFEPLTKDALVYHTDKMHGMVRTEVVCGKCNSHLGHVFDDGHFYRIAILYKCVVLNFKTQNLMRI